MLSKFLFIGLGGRGVINIQFLHQNLELKLAKLSKNPNVIRSLKIMEEDIAAGLHRKKPGKSPLDYIHNKLINNLFKEAKTIAWARIANDPDVVLLRTAHRKAKAAKANTTANPEKSRAQYEEVNQLLQMTNR